MILPSLRKVHLRRRGLSLNVPGADTCFRPTPVHKNLGELDASTRKKPSSGSKATSSAKKSTPEGWDNKGKLAGIASKVLMKVLWVARLARCDLLKAVSYLARFVTRWSTQCDAMLHRLMCYIDSTKHHRMVSWVGDTLPKINPHLFVGADFAGDPVVQRCTSGYHLVARGPCT